MSKQTEIQWGEVDAVTSAGIAPWKEVPISEVADFLQGLAINTKTKHLLSSSGLPLLRIKDLLENTHEFYVNESEAPKKTIVNENDLIITRTGQVGYVFMGKKGVLHNNSFRIIPKSAKIYLPFVYWFFNRASSREYLTGISAGSAQPDLTHKIFSAVEIPLPPLPEQRAIAFVLSSLDDKIDLLHRQNATLEALAETLFRQWFVEEAKEEWEDCKLEDLCSLVASGGTPSTRVESYYNGEINWYSTKELKDKFLFTSESRITQSGLDNSSAKLFPANTVVIAIYAAPTVGRLGILANESAFNQAACGLVADTSVCCFEFLYLLLKSQRAELNAMASGSAQQNLNVGKIRAYPAFKVPKHLMNSFEDVVSPLFNKIRENSTQIQTLSTLRDTLLPKLMSGEVRVAY